MRAHVSPDTVRTIQHAGAAFFILASPFLGFLKRYRYPLLNSEILLLVGALAAVSAAIAILTQRSRFAAAAALALLLTFFIDGQYSVLGDGYHLVAMFALLFAGVTLAVAHVTRVLAVAGAVVFVTTVALPIAVEIRAPFTAGSSGLARGPLIVHIVLDGHIGLEGLNEVPGAGPLAGDIEAFYRRHGFVLFGSAYSEHFDTHRSIGHAFNLSPGRFERDLLSGANAGYMWRLARNRYFEDLLNDGHTITVHQSAFLDVCASLPRTTCHAYDHTGVAALASTRLGAFEKAHAMLTIYLLRTKMYRELSFQYANVRSRLLIVGFKLPIWQNRANTMSPIVALQAMQRLTVELAAAKRGDVIMAHLLLPHSPYVFDAGCTLLPPSEWLTRTAAEAPRGMANTPESRVVRYARYAEQLRCVYRHLDRLLDAIPQDLERDAIIIVHGDHGARITLSDPDPLPVQATELSPADFLDSYSTLFAVRGPKLKPSYDNRQISIGCLLKALVESGYQNTARVAACRSEPAVFVSRASGHIEKHPLPSFD